MKNMKNINILNVYFLVYIFHRQVQVKFIKKCSAIYQFISKVQVKFIKKYKYKYILIWNIKHTKN